jgi:N-acetylglucosamine repressor
MTATRAGSKRLLRDLNQSIVLNLIADRGPLSRTELARQSGLPPATITRIAGEFVTAGLVSEAAAESSGGRRPTLLRINPRAGHVVGVKLREDGATLAVCDLSCTVIHQSEAAVPIEAPAHRAVEATAEAIERCLSEAGVNRRRVLGAGVGLAGLIDSERGICHYSTILGWHDVEIGPALEYRLRMPVRVDNDVNTLAVAERHFGAGRDRPDFLLVTVGRGIGLGIVIGGEIYRGAHGGAGEFGHMAVDTAPDAPLCNCGKRGCLEAIASDYGILRAVTGADPGHHVEDAMGALLERAQAGDAAIRAVFTRAGAALGVAIANLVNIFDPALVLLGGEGLRAGDLLLVPLRETLPLHLFGRTGQDVTLAVHAISDVEWARGAASLVLREVFRPPIYEQEGPPVIEALLAPEPVRRRGRGVIAAR